MSRLVVLDAAGTLLEVAGGVGEAYARCAREAGAELGDGAAAARAIERGFGAAHRAAPPLAFGALGSRARAAAERAWWRDVARAALADAGILSRVSFERFFDLAWAWFGRAEAWHVFDDVRPGLRALRGAGVPLAVFSNWDGRLPGVLVALGLDGFFARIVVSASLPAAKPDPAAYRAVAEAFAAGAPAWSGELLMVGDRPDHDVAPARAAGWDAILLDRAAGGDVGAALADGPRVRSLVELAEHVLAAPATAA